MPFLHVQARYDSIEYHSFADNALHAARIFSALELGNMTEQIQSLSRLNRCTELCRIYAGKADKSLQAVNLPYKKARQLRRGFYHYHAGHKRPLGHFGKDTRLQEITPKKAAVFIAQQTSRAIGHENDVDFENCRLVIASREGTADIPPFYVKDHEARRVPLPAHTIDLLTQLQTQAPEGAPYILVNNVLRNFKSHCKRAGIKPVGKVTVHTLRKSCGQNWADNLPMNVVKELMGHSSIAATQEFYAQVDDDH